jgi:endonuclease III
MAYLAHDHVEDLDGEALGAIAQEAEALLTGIRYGRYVSTPSQEACQHCGFQSVCGEVWQAPA